MNYAVIFAGGSGQRMNSKGKPKQFLELHGKPIIIYTIEVFENHPDIDGIVVVCLENYIGYLKKLLHRYDITKVMSVIPGGDTGFDSIYNGLAALESAASLDDIAIIHDGVRPLVDADMINRTIECALKNGTAVTTVPVTEGIILSNDGETFDSYADRKCLYATKAPQAYRYGTISALYKRAKEDGISTVESAHLCSQYGVKLHMARGRYNNIKITTATDYYIFRAIFEAVENEQIEGY